MDSKIFLLTRMCITLLISSFILSCSESLPENNNKIVSENKKVAEQFVATASWDAQREMLAIAGFSPLADNNVNVYTNQDQKEFLGVAEIKSNGSWQLEVFPTDLNKLPCKIFAASGLKSATVTVENAPPECLLSSSSITSREVITASNPPNGSINQPSGASVDVILGEILTFEASATDPEGDNNFTFVWDFGSYTLRKVGQKVAVKFDTLSTVNVSLLVRDSTGTWDPSRASIMINVVAQGGGSGNSNTIPNGTIVRPSNNRNIDVGDSVRFSAAGSDPQNRPLNYAWDFGASGIPNSTNQTPGRLRFDSAGTFDVRMTVSNDLGEVDPTPDSVRITVNATNTIAAAPDGLIVSPSKSGFFITVGDTLTLMGSASGSDDDDLTYTWDVGTYGPQMTGQNVEMTFNKLGPVTLKLFVKNKKNEIDPTPAILTFSVVQIVAQSNSAPFSEIVAPTTNQTINAGEAVFFSGNALDPDGDMPLHFLWNFDGALPFSTAQTPGAVIFTTPGVFRVTMQSIDSLGQADPTPDSRIITVNGINTSPPDSFISTPANNVTITVGSSVNFSGFATDPDQNMPYKYFWDFAGAAPSQTGANPGPITFNNAGVYEVSLRAEDASGAKDPTPATVQVSVSNISAFNEPPDSTIITPSLDMEIFEGDSLEFLGTGVDPNGDSLTYFWDFDSAVSNQTSINPGFIRFTRAGIYNISLTTTDRFGIADPTPANVKITVKAPPSNVAPDSTITSPSINRNITEGDSINFSGFGTDPDGNTPLTYLWNFDGAVPNLRTNNPGTVIFSNPGVYRVRLSVTDSSGLTDPTPAERIIVVDALNRPNGNLAPNGVIMTPSENTQVTIGDSLGFTAAGIDPDGNLPLTYRWNFDGVIPNSIAQNPGLVTFTQVGTYRIVLSTTDAFGSADPTPAERLITVVGNATTNNSPRVSINLPRGNQSITVNDVIHFSGTGFDIDNNTPLTYVWDFDGAVPNVVGETPGNVTFKKPGTFVVTLNVIDSLGAVSANPATVSIVVNESGGSNTGGGNAPGNNANWQIINPSSNVLDLPLGSSYTFEGANIGLDGRASSFSFWNFGGYFPLNSIGTSVTKTFSKPGSVTVKYYAKGAIGTFASPDIVTVNVR